MSRSEDEREIEWGDNQAAVSASTTGYRDSKSNVHTKIRLRIDQLGRQTQLIARGESGESFCIEQVALDNLLYLELNAEGDYELTLIGKTLCIWLTELIRAEPAMVTGSKGMDGYRLPGIGLPHAVRELLEAILAAGRSGGSQ